MDLTKSANLTLQNQSRWPNLIIFPRELKQAIPDYGSRALVFDSLSGSAMSAPVTVAGMPDQAAFDLGKRIQLQLHVHETGSLDAKFGVLMDLDSATTRALGEYLIRLAGEAG